MQKVDKEKVNAVIAEASKDSRFYEKQVRKKERSEQSLINMREKIEKFKTDKQSIQSIQILVDKKLNALEKERNLNRIWVHVDMDMFFVACEIRDRPELKDKPVACGGIGMISTANYVAREFGVRSAMPGFIALKLCPELILIPGNYEKYKETAKRFKNIIEEYDPDYESGGLDEAILDLTGYANEHGLTKKEEIEKVCYDMRMRINTATGITCSCGIGPNKMLAKLSTEINKPNGQYYMSPVKEDILDFLSKLPVRKIPGIGSSAEQLLNGLGINTCKHILDSLPEVYVAFTENAFDFFLRSALGISRCYHEMPEDRKSVSVSRTFQVITKVPEMEKKVQEIAFLLAEDLQYYKKKAKHITLIIKTHNFDVKNKGVAIDRYTDDGTEITNTCLKLLKEFMPLDPLRLVGIRATQLVNEQNLKSLDSFFNKPSTTNNKDDSASNKQINFNQDNKKEKEKDQDKEYSKRVAVVGRDYADTVPFPGMDDIIEVEDSNATVVSAPLEVREDSSKLTMDNIRQINRKQQREEITCPVCNTAFESGVNKARINNHIDKCLSNLGNPPPEPTASTTTKMTSKIDEKTSSKNDNSNLGSDTSKSISAVDRKKEDAPKKRKLEEKPATNFKKTKKTAPVMNVMKLDAFFGKK